MSRVALQNKCSHFCISHLANGGNSIFIRTFPKRIRRDPVGAAPPSCGIKALRDEWDECFVEASIHVRGLQNLCEQYQDCIRVHEYSLKEFEDYPNLKRKLIYKITNAIQEEYEHLREIRNRLSNSTHEVQKKFNALNRLTEELTEEPYLGPWHPRLSLMLQMGQDSCEYYSDKVKLGRELMDKFVPSNNKLITSLCNCFEHTAGYDKVNDALFMMQYILTPEKKD